MLESSNLYVLQGKDSISIGLSSVGVLVLLDLLIFVGKVCFFFIFFVDLVLDLTSIKRDLTF